jgi:hypothetical protein
MKETLGLDTVGNIDQGALRIAFNNGLKLLTQDMSDRPMLDKARTLVLKIEMKPIVDTNSSAPHLDSIDAKWEVDAKVPAIASAGVTMKPQQNGQLYFHGDLPQDPDDETVMDVAEQKRLERQQQQRRDQANGTNG